MKKNLLLIPTILFAMVANVAAQSFSKAFSFGGSNTLDDKVKSVKIDGNGNMYFAGFFNGTVDFNPSGQPQTVTSTGGSDGFLLKLDSSGVFQWISTFDAIGTDDVQAAAMDLDSNDYVFITGYFSGTMDFNGAGSNTLTSNGGKDIFVAKFNNNGSIIWAKKAGSTGEDIGKGISISGAGSAYITGTFSGTVDFDPDGSSTTNIISHGGTDVFVWKLTPGGNLSWAIGYGDTGTDDALDVRGQNNFVYTVGTFNGTVDFNPAAGIDQLTATGASSDVFIQKLDNLGNFVYAKQIGNASVEHCYSIEVDQDNNLYVAGSFQGTIDPDPNGGTSNITSTGALDGYVLQLDSAGDFQWARTIGGTGDDEINRIALGEFNNLYAIGDFEGTMDINTDGPNQPVSSNGGYDIFSIKLTNTGNYISGFHFGSANDDNGNHITTDAFGSIYLSGSFRSIMDVSPWQPTAGSLLTSNGDRDGFVAKYRAYTVGLNEISDAPQFALYPNPSRHSFYIVPPSAMGTCTIALYDAQGKLAMPVYMCDGSNPVTINHNLASGIYTVKLTGKTVLTKKLIVGL